MKPGQFRLRKTTSVHQEHPIYELIDEDQNILLDVTKNDAGVFEACIMDNQGTGRVVQLNILLGLIQEAQQKIESDK